MEKKIAINYIQSDADLSDFYPDAIEEKFPPNCPKPREATIGLARYTDADQVGNLSIRRSHTGIIHFLNYAPISWYRKRQTTVESSEFRSEVNALSITVNQIIAIRQKLRYMRVCVDQPNNNIF